MPADPKKSSKFHQVIPWAVALLVLALSVAQLLYGEIVWAVLGLARQMKELPPESPGFLKFLDVLRWTFTLTSLALAVLIPVRRPWKTYVLWGWAAIGLIRTVVLATQLGGTNEATIAKLAGLWGASVAVALVSVRWLARNADNK